jgi:ABC-type uncharacterized transport system involved in gliding motility auxiliary subunit
VLLLLDPILGAGGLERSSFGPWLEGYGVKLEEDIVVDPTNPLPFYSAETFFANDYEAHPITEALEDANYPVIFSLARSVSTVPIEGETGIEVTQLLRSSPEAWGETNLAALDAVAKDDADIPGPVGLGVAVELRGDGAAATGGPEDGSLTVLDEEKPPPAAGMQVQEEQEGQEEQEETTAPSPGSPVSPAPDSTSPAPDIASPAPGIASRPGRLVVFGDSDFASNAQIASVGNPTLLLNALNWLVERENLLAIPAKKADQVQLNLTRRDLGTIYLIVLVALPLASLSAGVGVYLRRRR